MLAHLVHQRRSLLRAPSASAIRYTTLHLEVLRCHPSISDYSYPRLSWLWTGPWNQPGQDGERLAPMKILSASS